jgi:hypothetical protein
VSDLDLEEEEEEAEGALSFLLLLAFALFLLDPLFVGLFDTRLLIAVASSDHIPATTRRKIGL